MNPSTLSHTFKCIFWWNSSFICRGYRCSSTKQHIREFSPWWKVAIYIKLWCSHTSLECFYSVLSSPTAFGASSLSYSEDYVICELLIQKLIPYQHLCLWYYMSRFGLNYGRVFVSYKETVVFHQRSFEAGSSFLVGRILRILLRPLGSN